MTRARFFLPAAALLAWGAGGFAAFRAYRPHFPPPSEILVPVKGAAGDMFSLALGTRRLFADLWFIRLMQYYGTREKPLAGKELECAEHPGAPRHDHHGLNGEGLYPEFFSRARHILELDPHFASAGLYAAGSLAFNMDRPAEAEALLNFGIKYAPREWKYATLLAAVGYSKAQDPAAVARTITPLIRDKDCPVMLKQLAAFLNKKAGDLAAAAVIYSDIAATSRDAAYVDNARRELEKLSKKARRP